MMVSPAWGLVSNVPHRVLTMFVPVAPAGAYAGRSLKMESPLLSWPVVMLNGVPEFAIMNGLSRIPLGSEKDPPKNKRCRTSNAARP